MKQYFGCDAHKRYSVFASVDEAMSSRDTILNYI